MINEKNKIIILHNIMAPYRIPLFNKISQINKIDLKVFFLSKIAKNRKWKVKNNINFKYKVLPNFQLNFLGKDLFTIIINYTFPFIFFKEKFDIVITAGWADISNILAFFITKIKRKKFIIWCESTENEPNWRRSISLPLVKLIVRHSDACLASGIRAKKYLIKLGAEENKIFITYNTVDINEIIKNTNILLNQKNDIKKNLNIDTDKIILFVGQFIDRKGVKYLLDAYRIIQQEIMNTTLLLVGYGKEKNTYEKYIAENNLKNVVIHDHIDISQMPNIYNISNLFVLPSTEEIWGLVVNEAMACGLPIITTDKVGCSSDLVMHNKNGFIVPARNAEALAIAMKKIILDQELSNTFSLKSKEIIRNFTIEKVSHGFVKAINYTNAK